MALITGASSGIGRAYAERLATDGNDLIVVARRGDRLDEFKARLELEHGVSVQTLVANLDRIGYAGGGCRGSRSAAGVRCRLCRARPLHAVPETSPEQAEQLVKLNVLAPMRLIHAALPSMVARRKGTIISIATQLVFSATSGNPQLPQRAVYAASKAFLFTFIRLLALELRESGVRLQVVCPGVVKTEFHTRQNMDMSHMPRLEPEQVIQASMLALDRGEIVCIPSLEDAGLLLRHDESENAILMGGMRPALAERYSL